MAAFPIPTALRACLRLMRRPQLVLTVLLIAAFLSACTTKPMPANESHSEEGRAIEFLKREVPAWSRDNGCFSCHNNGDAARALFAAKTHGYDIPQSALAGTFDWLKSPDSWDHNRSDPGFSDQRLADVQFASALMAAIESGAQVAERAAVSAAWRVIRAQAEDGSWPIDSANPVGSPATYGTTLATFMAWSLLKQVSSTETAAAIQKAEENLLSIKPDTVPNAAVGLMVRSSHHEKVTAIGDELRETDYSPVRGGYESCLNLLRHAQTADGGWGPYADSPPEAFDTALVLLALAEFRGEPGVTETITRGRRFLIETQLPDGSWPATTRPSGGRSYAQQISTTGWVTLALLATR